MNRPDGHVSNVARRKGGTRRKLRVLLRVLSTHFGWMNVATTQEETMEVDAATALHSGGSLSASLCNVLLPESFIASLF